MKRVVITAIGAAAAVFLALNTVQAEPGADDEEAAATPLVVPGDPVDLMRKEIKPPTPAPTQVRAPSALEEIQKQVSQEEHRKTESDAEPPRELERVPPYFEAHPIADYKFELFTESIFSMEKLDFPPEVEEEPETAPWQEFKEDTFKLFGDLPETIVRFENESEELAGNKPRGFYISVRFDEQRPLDERLAIDPLASKADLFRKGDSIVIKHSLPKMAEEAAGIRIKIGLDRQRRVLLRGRDGTSMVLIVPQVGRPGIRGVMLCPRDYDMWKLKGGYAGLDLTGYEMVGAETSAVGRAQAAVVSGFGPGLARATIQVTKNILKGKFVSDTSRLQYPAVSVEYFPVESDRPVARNKESITAGIRLETIHHNSLNHKTVSTGTVIMTLKRIDVKRPFPLTFKDVNFKVAAGSCFALIKESAVTHQYFKEQLPPLPEGAKEKTE